MQIINIANKKERKKSNGEGEGEGEGEVTAANKIVQDQNENPINCSIKYKENIK